MKNTILLIMILLFLSGCFIALGKKCTYTQDGTKISSIVWLYDAKPIDLDKTNCN